MNLTRVLPAAAILTISTALGLAPLQARSATPFAHSAYTAAQAATGAKLYAANCSACHGADLKGGAFPALVGDAFTSQWIDKSAGTVYDVMSTQMPPTAPGSLKPRDYLALLAYILQQNKYHGGSTPLTQAWLNSIEIASLRARQP